MTDPVIELSDVWKTYPSGDQVLKSVNLRVGAGEFVGIYGRSGSGKSTLLRLMGLLDRPTKGSVRVAGVDAATVPPAEAARVRRERVGYIFQGFNLVPHITALENIEVPLWLCGVRGDERRRRACDDLRRFGLDRLADRYPGELSHGEQQRVAAIRAMVTRPGVVLADEPTSSLDDESARTLLGLMASFNRDLGTTIVMVSTSQEEARLGSSAYRLSEGSLAPG